MMLICLPAMHRLPLDDHDDAPTAPMRPLGAAVPTISVIDLSRIELCGCMAGPPQFVAHGEPQFEIAFSAH